MGPLFFIPRRRERSRRFYRELLEAASQRDAEAGERLTREMMTESIIIGRLYAIKERNQHEPEQRPGRDLAKPAQDWDIIIIGGGITGAGFSVWP